MTLPLIGISCRVAVDTAWCPPIIGVRRGYVDAIAMAGGAPILIPPGLDEAALVTIYESLDGVLLSGGEDIDPAHYGETPHPKLGEVDSSRDAVELTLARWAFADGKPLLAICRGIQVLNVAMDGALIQDIASQHDTATDHEAGIRQQRWDQADHLLLLESGSRLATILGATELEVNSLHHQAVSRVAQQLRVVGRAPDGIVEAVEAHGGGFCIGVQCHPEELWQAADQRWRRLFRAFVEAARQQ